MIGAFQFGAFQFSGFQETGSQPGSSIPWWIIDELRRKRKKKALPDAEPTGAEIVETIRNIRARINWRPKMPAPLPKPRVNLEPFMQAQRDAEFRAFIDAMISADEWDSVE